MTPFWNNEIQPLTKTSSRLKSGKNILENLRTSKTFSQQMAFKGEVKHPFSSCTFFNNISEFVMFFLLLFHSPLSGEKVKMYSIKLKKKVIHKSNKIFKRIITLL